MAVNKKKRKAKQKHFLRSSRGVAVVEMLPLLFIFVMFFGITFGFWSAIHKATLHSIAARHYGFEVIHNRSDLYYHRDTDTGKPNKNYYGKPNKGLRYFAIVEHQTVDPELKPRINKLNLFDKGELTINSIQDPTLEVNPIKLKIGYGICIDYECGGL